MALLMLLGALWMALYPQSLIDVSQGLQEGLRRLPPGSPWYARRAGPLPDDRRTRMGIRLFGMLLAAVAAAYLYQTMVRLLAQ